MSESDEFYRRQKAQRAAAKRLAKSQDERDKGVTQLEKLSDTCLRNVGAATARAMSPERLSQLGSWMSYCQDDEIVGEALGFSPRLVGLLRWWLDFNKGTD